MNVCWAAHPEVVHGVKRVVYVYTLYQNVEEKYMSICFTDWKKPFSNYSIFYSKSPFSAEYTEKIKVSCAMKCSWRYFYLDGWSGRRGSIGCLGIRLTESQGYSYTNRVSSDCWIRRFESSSYETSELTHRDSTSHWFFTFVHTRELTSSVKQRQYEMT